PFLMNMCYTCKSSIFFFSSRRRHTSSKRDWSSDVCSSDLLSVDTLLDEEAGRRHADLAGVAELGAHERLHRLFHVGVRKDDRRRMAAQFHGRELHVLAGQDRKSVV